MTDAVNSADQRDSQQGDSGQQGGSSQADGEDAKLLTLARAARARTSAAEGAAVRDGTGRTYVACTVDLPSLSLSALQAAVAMAASSGADALEAAVLVSDADEPADEDLNAVRDLGHPGVPVLLADYGGTVRGSWPAL
jgi:hypothetical protein